MPKVTRATPAERAAYTGLYPLHGWVTIEGHKCAVESLDGPPGDPRYEVILPEGFHWFREGLHTILCDDMRDLRERVACVELTPCTSDCK